MHSLLKNCEIKQVLGYYAAGTTKRTSDIIDMQGYDGVCFVAGLGTIIENGTLDVFVEQNIENSANGMARLATTTAHTVSAANAALTKSAIIVDVYKPRERYLQCNITPATQNAVILGIVAILYKAHARPVTPGATILKSTQLIDPAEA